MVKKLYGNLKYIRVNFRKVKPDYALNFQKDVREFNVYDMKLKRNLGNYTEEYLLNRGFTKSQLEYAKKDTGYFKKLE